MEEKIVELLQSEKIDEAIELYANEFRVTWSEAKSVIETYQSELSLFSPNHRSDSAFPMEEVNMLNLQVDSGEVDIALEYLQEKYGVESPEAEFVLDEMSNGKMILPSYDLNTEEIVKLLKDGRKIAAIARYEELYNVDLRTAKAAVERIQEMLEA